MNLNNLMSMDRPALVELALKHGLKPHHKAKAETIAKQIIEHVTQPKQEDVHPSQVAKPDPTLNTQEQVLDKIKPFVDRGLEATFSGDTWTFKCRGAEECGHMSVPLRLIQQKARNVSYGARRLPAIKDGKNIIMMV